MKDNKFDLVHLVMEPYVLDILHALDKPKRFSDLIQYVKNRKTLSIKLSKLLKYGLVEHFPLKVADGYANSYTISKKGMKLLKGLEKL